MPVTTTFADPTEPPHGTTGHLYDNCREPDCVSLRNWLRDRPPMAEGRGRRLTGMTPEARMAWHRDKPRSTRRSHTRRSDVGALGSAGTGEEETGEVQP